MATAGISLLGIDLWHSPGYLWRIILERGINVLRQNLRCPKCQGAKKSVTDILVRVLLS